jgi:citrate synthase
MPHLAEINSYINPKLFSKYEVKRGLHDINGRDVLTGLTEIGELHSYIMDENEIVPVPSQLFYRGLTIAIS